MRISDWSSDVCSSDLGERQSVFSAAALQEETGRIGLGKVSYAQIEAAIEAATKQRELIDRTFLDRRGAQFAGFTTRLNVETEARMLRIEAEGRGTLAPIASPLAAAKSIASAAVQRSEEHTSELQSLMRISYAVFCLKKTKQ